MNFFIKFLILISIIRAYESAFDDEEKCTLGLNCQLPFCNCDSNELPINLPKRHHLSEIPQLVILTIDDDKLDVKSYQIYRKLFENRLNSNNCSINMGHLSLFLEHLIVLLFNNLVINYIPITSLLFLFFVDAILMV